MSNIDKMLEIATEVMRIKDIIHELRLENLRYKSALESIVDYAKTKKMIECVHTEAVGKIAQKALVSVEGEENGN